MLSSTARAVKVLGPDTAQSALGVARDDCRCLEKQLADTQRRLVAVKGKRASFRRSLRQVTRERDRALKAAAEAASARDPPGSAPSGGD